MSTTPFPRKNVKNHNRNSSKQNRKPKDSLNQSTTRTNNHSNGDANGNMYSAYPLDLDGYDEDEMLRIALELSTRETSLQDMLPPHDPNHSPSYQQNPQAVPFFPASDSKQKQKSITKQHKAMDYSPKLTPLILQRNISSKGKSGSGRQETEVVLSPSLTDYYPDLISAKSLEADSSDADTEDSQDDDALCFHLPLDHPSSHMGSLPNRRKTQDSSLHQDIVEVVGSSLFQPKSHDHMVNQVPFALLDLGSEQHGEEHDGQRHLGQTTNTGDLRHHAGKTQRIGPTDTQTVKKPSRVPHSSHGTTAPPAAAHPPLFKLSASEMKALSSCDVVDANHLRSLLESMEAYYQFNLNLLLPLCMPAPTVEAVERWASTTHPQFREDSSHQRRPGSHVPKAHGNLPGCRTCTLGCSCEALDLVYHVHGSVDLRHRVDILASDNTQARDSSSSHASPSDVDVLFPALRTTGGTGTYNTQKTKIIQAKLMDIKSETYQNSLYMLHTDVHALDAYPQALKKLLRHVVGHTVATLSSEEEEVLRARMQPRQSKGRGHSSAHIRDVQHRQNTRHDVLCRVQAGYEQHAASTHPATPLPYNKLAEMLQDDNSWCEHASLYSHEFYHFQSRMPSATTTTPTLHQPPHGHDDDYSAVVSHSMRPQPPPDGIARPAQSLHQPSHRAQCITTIVLTNAATPHENASSHGIPSERVPMKDNGTAASHRQMAAGSNQVVKNPQHQQNKFFSLKHFDLNTTWSLLSSITLRQPAIICPICLESFTVLIITRCYHYFCMDCLLTHHLQHLTSMPLTPSGSETGLRTPTPATVQATSFSTTQDQSTPHSLETTHSCPVCLEPFASPEFSACVKPLICVGLPSVYLPASSKIEDAACINEGTPPGLPSWSVSPPSKNLGRASSQVVPATPAFSLPLQLYSMCKSCSITHTHTHEADEHPIGGRQYHDGQMSTLASTQQGIAAQPKLATRDGDLTAAIFTDLNINPIRFSTGPQLELELLSRSLHIKRAACFQTYLELLHDITLNFGSVAHAHHETQTQTQTHGSHEMASVKGTKGTWATNLLLPSPQTPSKNKGNRKSDFPELKGTSTSTQRDGCHRALSALLAPTHPLYSQDCMSENIRFLLEQDGRCDLSHPYFSHTHASSAHAANTSLHEISKDVKPLDAPLFTLDHIQRQSLLLCQVQLDILLQCGAVLDEVNHQYIDTSRVDNHLPWAFTEYHKSIKLSRRKAQQHGTGRDTSAITPGDAVANDGRLPAQYYSWAHWFHCYQQDFRRHCASNGQEIDHPHDDDTKQFSASPSATESVCFTGFPSEYVIPVFSQAQQPRISAKTGKPQRVIGYFHPTLPAISLYPPLAHTVSLVVPDAVKQQLLAGTPTASNHSQQQSHMERASNEHAPIRTYLPNRLTVPPSLSIRVNPSLPQFSYHPLLAYHNGPPSIYVLPNSGDIFHKLFITTISLDVSARHQQGLPRDSLDSHVPSQELIPDLTSTPELRHPPQWALHPYLQYSNLTSRLNHALLLVYQRNHQRHERWKRKQDKKLTQQFLLKLQELENEEQATHYGSSSRSHRSQTNSSDRRSLIEAKEFHFPSLSSSNSNPKSSATTTTTTTTSTTTSSKGVEPPTTTWGVVNGARGAWASWSSTDNHGDASHQKKHFESQWKPL